MPLTSKEYGLGKTCPLHVYEAIAFFVSTKTFLTWTFVARVAPDHLLTPILIVAAMITTMMKNQSSFTKNSSA